MLIAARLIARKRDGDALSGDEWRAIVHAFAAGELPDYQMSALLMATFFRGLDEAELDALTDAMLDSGRRLSVESGPPRIDKHSTGGVGDKVSLVLAPLVAACGVAVPMISGRALGHSGGTLDKLEAIPGLRTDLSLDATRAQVERIGCALLGQTDDIAPADRRLYALRDVTATVEVIPLIAASIMSKKLAEGLNGLVLDVKRGGGAFLPALEDGLQLAQEMVRLGTNRGCPTVALITAMDQPLGHACGNALETEEAIAALRGEGPSDLMEVTFGLGGEMLTLAGMAADPRQARPALEGAITSGAAAAKFAEIIEAQGGNPRVVDDPGVLPQARHERVVTAAHAGVVTAIDTRAIGWGVVEMGGGRVRMDDTIDPTAGFVITVRVGDRVEAGEPMATIYADNEAAVQLGVECVRGAVDIGERAGTPPLPLISHRVSGVGVESLAGS